ncbi:terminase small subunit [Jeotgalibaca porci]|uniref:terminase small subunit n=1 Tax=Jeotgalibaca porci TaxID=1868793 RepID=UPI0035A15A6A
MAYEDLNIKQRKFIDEYIISGNATQSAKNAGYSGKTAYSQGQRMLKNVEISAAVKERTEALFNDKAMTVAEALAISASIARGDPQESYFKEIDNMKGGEVTKETIRYYTPAIEDRQRSIDHILKVSGAYVDKQEIELSGGVQFVDDI